MKIAIDISPLSTGHKVRGTGFYLNHLRKALVRYFPEHEYTFFSGKEPIPSDIDVVHYPYFEPFHITLPIIKKHKTIVTVLDLIPIIFPQHFPAGIKGNFKWQIQRRLLSRVDAIVTDSQSAKKDIVNIIHFPEKKVHVSYLAPGEEFVPTPITMVEKKRLRATYNLPEKFVLYVGDVTWNKNVSRLVEAVQQINIPLVLVGKAISNTNFDRTNPWNRDLIKVEQLTQNDKNIIKLGFVSSEDLVALYNLATVFIFPSIYEGFGLPVIEAMRCGTPVITTKEASLPEVGGDAVYYADGYNTSAMAKAVKEVFENKKLQEELSSKGLARAKEFSWKKTAEETIAVYKSIV